MFFAKKCLCSEISKHIYNTIYIYHYYGSCEFLVCVLQKHEEEENIWWDNYVDTLFHSMFSKQCKGRFTSTYKIQISGVPFKSIMKHIVLFNGLTYDNVQLVIEINKDKNVIKTVQTNNKTADWLIDKVFNNGKLYTYENDMQNLTFSHYGDSFYWSKLPKQELVLKGFIKYKTESSPWQVMH